LNEYEKAASIYACIPGDFRGELRDVLFIFPEAGVPNGVSTSPGMRCKSVDDSVLASMAWRPASSVEEDGGFTFAFMRRALRALRKLRGVWPNLLDVDAAIVLAGCGCYGK
jgi:hypothetical protein